jgi:hypothetical protein
VIFEVAHLMGLLPLAWLALRGERRAEWWWIAVAFGVSWIADATAHFVNPWIVSTVYPISQAAIILAVIAERNEARVFMWLLIAVGLVTILTEGVTGPTLFLETVAAASIVAVVWPLPLGRLRLTLLVAFGVGFLAWVGYVISPGWTTWGIYQAVRALSLVMFCWASLQTRPRLQIA